MAYSTQKISTNLIEEIKKALQSVSYGSIEIYVQDKTVTQISIRSIKKTSFNLRASSTILEDETATHTKIKVLTIKK